MSYWLFADCFEGGFMNKFGNALLLTASALVSSAFMLPHVALAQGAGEIVEEEQNGIKEIVVTARKVE